jgi:hypothetical protein
MGGFSSHRKGNLDVEVKAGVVKEIVKKIDGMSGQAHAVEQRIEEPIDELNQTNVSPEIKLPKIIEEETANDKPSPQTPPQRHLNERGIKLGDEISANTASQGSYSDSDDDFPALNSPSKHCSHSHSRSPSSSSSSDPFYIRTPKSSSNTSFTPQESFSQDRDIIYGGTSLLNVPIDGTKWNWNGKQWIGTRAVPVAIHQEEMEFAGIQMRRTN